MNTLRIAVRTLARHRTFSLLALLTLALGLGATAAIYTLVDEVVLDPLPYPEPGELVRVEHPAPGYGDRPWGLSEAGWYAMLDGNRTLDGLAVYSRAELVLGGEDGGDRVAVAMTSTNVFDVLGVGAVAGRVLREDDLTREGNVGVLGYEYWRTRFGADPGVVGRVLRVEGYPMEVVGVLEPGANLPSTAVDLWSPVSVSRENRPVNWHRFEAVGRLRDGVGPAAAEADLRRIVGRFTETLPTAYSPDFMERSGFDVRVRPLREHVVGDVDRALWIILAAVGMVLLIGCVNVANLFLVRLESRRRERAVQAALGATRWDLARRSLAETGTLAAGSAVLGLVLAEWALSLVLRLSPELPRAAEVALGLDTVLFAGAIAAAVALALGSLPVLRAGAAPGALREGVGLTASRRRTAVRGGLVAAEMALALVVLVGAGLMLRTFDNLRSVEPGFQADGALTVPVVLPTGPYRDYEPTAEFYRRLTERLEGLPDVVAAGATQQLPLTGVAGCSVMWAEDPEAQRRNEGCHISNTVVTPGYFEAMGIAVEGDAPSWDDVLARRGNVVVSAPVADRLWPGEAPSGQGIRGNGGEPPFYRVTGFAGPVRQNGLDEPPVLRVYYPMLPMDGAGLWTVPRSMTLVVRTAGTPPAALAGSIRSILSDLDPEVAVGEFRTMKDVVAGSTARTTFVMTLLALAAAVALVLGVVGLYGVVAYVVEQRRREIGIRMALGARAARVRRGVVAEAAAMAATGAAVGVVASIWTGRVLAGQLFDVEPTDPWTLALAVVVLLMVAVAAALVPAARAARVDPMRVLRAE